MGMLDGKTGLIVGIANERSYAYFIAKAILAEGGRCAFTHLPGEKNERRTARAVRDLGVENPWLVPLDAGSDEDLDRAFDAYAGEFGSRMDFMLHSIAFADREWLQPGSFHKTPREAYLGAIDISAYTLAAMSARATPMMRETGGSILCMSYYGSDKVIPGYNIMGVAKAALECTTRYLAAELGEHAIRVNAISGGYLRTLASSAVGGVDAISEQFKTRSPLRRNVEGDDVGKAAAFLLSNHASGITGETIYVDCGMNIVGV